MRQVQFEFNRLFGTGMYMSQYLAVDHADCQGRPG